MLSTDWRVSEMTRPDHRSQIHRSTDMDTRRFPTEILVLIFSYTISNRYVSLRPHESPVLLTRVCRHWRNVALSTPLLWSVLEVRDLPPLELCDSFSYSLATWLSLSDPVSLSFRFRAYRKHEAVLPRYLGCLFEHASRWKEVFLDVPNYDFFSTAPAPQFCALESLTVRGFQADDPVNHTLRYRLGGHPGPKPGIPSGMFIVSWMAGCSQSLRTLILDTSTVNISDADLAYALSGLRNLRSLTLAGYKYSEVLLNALTLTFSPSGQLETGQNAMLEDMALYIYFSAEVPSLFMALANMVKSRWHIPQNAMDGAATARLKTFGLDGRTWGGMAAVAPRETSVMNKCCAEGLHLKDNGVWQLLLQV